MTPEQLDQAAAQLAAAFEHLHAQPVITDADLEADDAAFPPALVDGKNPRENLKLTNTPTQ